MGILPYLTTVCNKIICFLVSIKIPNDLIQKSIELFQNHHVFTNSRFLRLNSIKCVNLGRCKHIKVISLEVTLNHYIWAYL